MRHRQTKGAVTARWYLTPPRHISPEGAIAWWPFDETAGPIAEDRAGNNPGEHRNGVIPAEGFVGRALQFDGVDDYVTVADSNLWAFAPNNFTIEFWANFSAPGGGTIAQPGDIFIGNDEGPGDQYKWFFALGGGYLFFHINGPDIGAQYFAMVLFSPTVGEWYHLAVTRSGMTYTIYVNGQFKGTTSTFFDVPNANAPLTIGQAEELGYMNGLLDEVTVYNRALTQEELASIVDAGRAGKCKDSQVGPARPVPAIAPLGVLILIGLLGLLGVGMRRRKG